MAPLLQLPAQLHHLELLELRKSLSERIPSVILLDFLYEGGGLQRRVECLVIVCENKRPRCLGKVSLAELFERPQNVIRGRQSHHGAFPLGPCWAEEGSGQKPE